ncbi:MAG: GNAT family N-acetyltransferase [Bacilli bacterium]|nr:GNAT family N-acetyltransferase [Bacilli bacterium]
MNIRKAHHQDLEVLKKLWYECFLEHDSKESIDYYFAYNFNLSNTFVLIEDHEIRCSLQLNQHQLIYQEKQIEVSFVVGVATFIKDRHQGYMKSLLNYALNYARDILKQDFMILQAYNWDLYRPFGFQNAYYKNIVSLTKKDLVLYETSSLIKPDEKDLLKIYQAYTLNLNGFKVRDLPYFRNLIIMNEIDNLTIVCSQKAYAFYKIDHQKALINECAYYSATDLLALLNNIEAEYYEFSTDLINFKITKKELFMMVKSFNNKTFALNNNNYISEWI